TLIRSPATPSPIRSSHPLRSPRSDPCGTGRRGVARAPTAREEVRRPHEQRPIPRREEITRDRSPPHGRSLVLASSALKGPSVSTQLRPVPAQPPILPLL